jgi:hypothetical protein
MPNRRSAASPWPSDPPTAERVGVLLRQYRKTALTTLDPLVKAWYPALAVNDNLEYRKLLELTAKMTLVGHACVEVAGQDFSARQQRIATLYGAICFLADSFLDDFGADATHEYIARFTQLLESGWFELRGEREVLFYVLLSRLVSERDILQPILRQAILRLHAAQSRDVELRGIARSGGVPRAVRARLKNCARDRSGHAIVALASFLVPELGLDRLAGLFTAGALIMYIDDHGDCHTDRRDGRVTYMNQLRAPEPALARLALRHFARLAATLPENPGRKLLLEFLLRYYTTRIEKHRIQQRRAGTAWEVYE